MRVRLLLACFTVTLVSVTLSFVYHRKYADLPERPLFHNDWGKHEFGFTGSWYPCYPLYDENGSVLFADFENNHLVIIIVDKLQNGIPSPQPIGKQKARLFANTPFEYEVEKRIDLLQVIRDREIIFERRLSDKMALAHYHELFYSQPSSFLSVLEVPDDVNTELKRNINE